MFFCLCIGSCAEPTTAAARAVVRCAQGIFSSLQRDLYSDWAPEHDRAGYCSCRIAGRLCRGGPVGGSSVANPAHRGALTAKFLERTGGEVKMQNILLGLFQFLCLFSGSTLVCGESTADRTGWVCVPRVKPGLRVSVREITPRGRGGPHPHVTQGGPAA